MAMKFKNKKDFGLKMRDGNLRAENTALVKGGSVVVGERWVQYADLRLDVQQLVADYMASVSRRIFNFRGDTMYVLVCVDGYGAPRIVPSIAMNRKNFGDIKTFPDLSGLLPLMLVRLQHDGSENLSAMLSITEQDIKIYKGYGNFTPRGARGATGIRGDTGYQGMTGWPGLVGYGGVTGAQGCTGMLGLWLQGATGSNGLSGASVPAFQSSFSTYIQDVVDDSIDAWIDTVDDGEDTIQDTV
jgi:hypothetical protein